MQIIYIDLGKYSKMRCNKFICVVNLWSVRNLTVQKLKKFDLKMFYYLLYGDNEKHLGIGHKSYFTDIKTVKQSRKQQMMSFFLLFLH